MLRIILPTTCVLCDGPAARNIDICSSCEGDLPWLKNYCQLCGLPLNYETTLSENKHCITCIKEPPAFTLTIAPFYYQSPIDFLITSLKFHHNLVYAKLLGQLLAQRITQYYTKDTLPTHIIPVPLHYKRLQERGFNQALEIARPIAKKLKLTLDKHSFQRTRHTLPQSSLPSKDRAQNIKNVFSAKKAFNIKHIAIIDDVITTGHTVREFAAVIKSSGVERIDIWCCARTAPAIYSNN